MKTNKICVYAICKDELKVIDKWIESMSEADYIVVLDTGSTDGTYEKLKEDPRITCVEQKIINPWRFDTARNESMKLIPEDANICVCTDPDELFEPGWAKILRSKWDDNLHDSCTYQYVWKHELNGAPSGSFSYDKIHCRHGWHWKYPIHEVLAPEDGRVIDMSRVLDLVDDICLHHYQDQVKSRASYYSLIQLRVEENPDDLMSRIYLIHECLYNSDYQKCIDEINNVLHLFEHRVKQNPDFTAHLYLFAGDALRGQNRFQDAADAYSHSLSIAPQYIEAYISLASVLVNNKKYVEAIELLQDCCREAKQTFVWFHLSGRSEHDIYNLLAAAYVCLEDYDMAFSNISKARHLNPTDEVICNNYSFIAEKLFSSIGVVGNGSGNILN